MKKHPWKSSALCVFAPYPEEVDRFCNFIKKEIAPDGIDTIVVIMRYNYQFESHPECRGLQPLSLADVKKMLATCKECGIHLVPKMNLMGHQSIQGKKENDGLLLGHPELDETPEIEETYYARSICPSHPDALPLVCDLMDEMVDAFEADTLHIGMDEIFDIGKCPRCRDKSTGELLAGWVTAIHDHLAARGVKTWMWGDRLLNAEVVEHTWEGADNGTETALPLLPKDIVITDWHYEDRKEYPSAGIFADAGLQVYLCPFRSAENAAKFIEYSAAHDKGNILGVMETTWTPLKFFMDGLEGIEFEEGSWYKNTMPDIVRCYKSLFRGEE